MRTILIFVLLLFVCFSGCSRQEKSSFNEGSLAQKVYNSDMQESTIKDILAAHKGEKVILKVWASWCMDCLKTLPDVEEFQVRYPDVPIIFLSVDEHEDDWRNGLAKYIDKYDIEAEQYFFNTGWSKKGGNDFIDYIGLDWIPRYMLIGEDGDINVYYAKKINATSIEKQLEK